MIFIGKYSITEEKLKSLYDSTEEVDKGDTIVASLTQAAKTLYILDRNYDNQFTYEFFRRCRRIINPN